ncbi:nucleoside-diphosphate kinase [Chitinivibrio alkaliphilus]|uniref:Nucleoside diphosphate kinase n=1 Tax=Chitinivibrio alkaliphilus ACht1 TaxID=1313304 RepID=U7D982_9BACT|nr:nucleoside-diphosphate kinase [Chitinivibrio alkaliphilus]ERP30960.1 nucleoside diphosphate kinase [Chitinivibrio alkaliphilus ACht1]
MAYEETLALIKPDAVKAGHTGKIIEAVIAAPFTICAIKKTMLNRAMAERFYAVHREKPFFDDLVQFMSSGPIYAMVLGGESALLRWRELMGATNFEEAAEGTLRKRFATSLGRNAVHGSDSLENACTEIAIFFSRQEVLPCDIPS